MNFRSAKPENVIFSMKISMAVLLVFLLKMTFRKGASALMRMRILLKRLQFGNKAYFDEKVLDFSIKVVYSGIK